MGEKKRFYLRITLVYVYSPYNASFFVVGKNTNNIQTRVLKEMYKKSMKQEAEDLLQKVQWVTIPVKKYRRHYGSLIAKKPQN